MNTGKSKKIIFTKDFLSKQIEHQSIYNDQFGAS